MKEVRKQAEQITQRLMAHPELLEQVQLLLEEVDDKQDGIANLDDAEDVIAERGREVLRSALESWAKSKAERASAIGNARRGGKKNCAG